MSSAKAALRLEGSVSLGTVTGGRILRVIELGRMSKLFLPRICPVPLT